MNESIFKSIIENSNDFVSVKDAAGRYVFVNAAAQRFLNLPAEQIIGKTAHELFAPHTAVKVSENDQKVLALGIPLTFEEDADIGSGHLHFLSTKFPYQLPGDAETGIVSISREISGELRIQEQLQRLALIPEQDPNAIIEMDQAGRIAYLNPAARRLFPGIQESAGEHPLLRPVWEDWLRQTGPVLDEPWRKEIEYQEKFYEIQVNAAERDMVCLYITDITGRRLAERARQEKEDLEAKTRFISVVSHELRTPLTVIKEGIAAVLDGSAGAVNGLQKDFLETAKRNVDRLGRFINDVLDFQKLDSGHMEYHFTAQNIHLLIQEVVRGVEPVAAGKHLTIETDLTPGELVLKFDADHMAQALMNLLGNAVKFTDKGKITVKSEVTDGGGKITVMDTGMGIKSEDFPKLFQVFSQLYSEKYRKPGSSGIGLMITKKIIEQHGGKIWVESEYGQGSRFVFWLPQAGSK